MCRAGLKLEAALEHWGIDVRGKTALDSGLSTGGFTDCLLQVRDGLDWNCRRAEAVGSRWDSQVACAEREGAALRRAVSGYACALQNGAAAVIGVDVGYGQVGPFALRMIDWLIG